jgi:hypothetical protein
MADDSYGSVYDELKKNPSLFDEAQYAIDRMAK